MVAAAASNTQLRRAPTGSGNLYDILDLILDKGIVIDAFVRVSLVGIEILTVDLRVVIASVDTYIRYAEAVQRLQLYERSGSKRLTDVMGDGISGMAMDSGKRRVKGAISDAGNQTREMASSAVNGVKRAVTGNGSRRHRDDDDDSGDEDRPRRRAAQSAGRR